MRLNEKECFISKYNNKVHPGQFVTGLKNPEIFEQQKQYFISLPSRHPAENGLCNDNDTVTHLLDVEVTPVMFETASMNKMVSVARTTNDHFHNCKVKFRVKTLHFRLGLWTWTRIVTI